MDRYDVAIAGGGIIGLTIAYELCTRGFRVAVLDGTDARMASSYGNAGYVSPSLGPLAMNVREFRAVAAYLASSTTTTATTPNALSSNSSGPIDVSMDAKDSQESMRMRERMMLIRNMALESREWYARMSSNLGFEYKHLGLLEVYLSREGLEHRLEQVKHLASMLNIQYKVLGGDDVHALEAFVRDTCAGALFYPDDALVNPKTLLRALKAALEAMDVTFLGNLEDVEFDSNDVRGRNGVKFVKGGDVKVCADTYILCTGAYKVRGLSLPIASARGYMVELVNQSTPRYPILCGERRVAIAMHDRLRLSGAFELCSVGSTINEERFDELLEWSKGYVTLSNITVVDRWSGYRPCTPDGLPIIGRVGNQGHGDGTSNVIVATGHCRLGITLAPATARLVAALVEGRDDVPDALKPNRYGL
ncbi:MAG: FAD-dependent oxidoreductase [Candidatus Nitrosocaldus sp.]